MITSTGSLKIMLLHINLRSLRSLLTYELPAVFLIPWCDPTTGQEIKIEFCVAVLMSKMFSFAPFLAANARDMSFKKLHKTWIKLSPTKCHFLLGLEPIVNLIRILLLLFNLNIFVHHLDWMQLSDNDSPKYMLVWISLGLRRCESR